jgi:uncharacterized protein YdeI (YjbR/CyaY-like superfamily)
MSRTPETPQMKVKFFRSPAAFRAWLEKNHDQARELWVGFHRKDSGEPSITYPEALDEALCFGWIDGVRRSLNSTSYTNRFSPRKPKSVWSLVNIKRVEELAKLGRMHAAGLAAFERRDQQQSQRYSYEREKTNFDDDFEKRFRAAPKAWEFFQAQAPWYRRTATWWVISAKREETRMKRLATLMKDCAQGRRLAILTPKSKNKKPVPESGQKT